MNCSELVNYFRTGQGSSGSAVLEARRAFEDQIRGLPIELVDLKNKFLGTSFRYQGRECKVSFEDQSWYGDSRIIYSGPVWWQQCFVL